MQQSSASGEPGPDSSVLSYATPGGTLHGEGTFAQKLAWVLYDWGNSGFGLIITGVLFSNFLIDTLLPQQLHDGELEAGLMIGKWFMSGDALFALMTAATALLVTLAAPVLGAIADFKGWTKRLLVIHAVGGSVVAMFTFFLREGDWQWGVVIYVLANYFFGTALTFYNAFLPRLTRPEKQGSLSGWGFAAGYVGGAIALIIAGIVIKNVSWGLLLGGAWWLIFSLPAFFLLTEFEPVARQRPPGSLVMAGFRQIGHTFRNIRQYRTLFIFLLAYLTYVNGIDTVINLSPPFATQVLHLHKEQVAMIFLCVQFVAFPGAVLCGYLSDRIGNKPVIVGTLVIWIFAVACVMWVQTALQFTIVACVIGLVLGGVQSSSRSLMALLAPKEIHNEAFGFFSLSGKALSVFGPLVYAGARMLFGPRMGVMSIIPFLLGGLLILLLVKEPKVQRT